MSDTRMVKGARFWLAAATLACLLPTQATLAQGGETQAPGTVARIRLGAQLGASFVNLRGPDSRVFITAFGAQPGVDEGLKFSGDWNFSAEISAEYPVTPTLSVLSGLGYARRSSFPKVEVDPQDPGATLQVRAEYLQIPVLARFYTTRSERLRPYFYAGLVLGFRLSAEAETRAAGTAVRIDASDTLKSTDFGYALGFGLQFRRHLELQFRQYYGTKDIIAVPFDDKITWGAAVFTLGYRF